MAGTGKRGDAKKTLILNLYGNDYFGKDKTLRRGHAPVKLEVINLGDITLQLASLMQEGRAKESKGSMDIDLGGYKVLGEGTIESAMVIHASAASKSAIEKVTKAGGQLIVKYGAKAETAPEKEVKKENAVKKVAKKK